MTQSAQLSWVPPRVSVISRGEDLILENPIPLAGYHPTLASGCGGTPRASDKPFVLQRDAEGGLAGANLCRGARLRQSPEQRPAGAGAGWFAPDCLHVRESREMALVQLGAMQVGLAVATISYAYSARSKSGGQIKHILGITQAPLVVMSDADLHMPKLSQWDLSGVQLFASSHAENHGNAGVQPLSALEADRGDTDDRG